jgi:acylaminoacyl-peptidase
MKQGFFISVFVFLLTPYSFSQHTSVLELTDVFSLEYVSSPRISPDGEQVIYVRNFKDIMSDRNYSNLWIINFDGTNNRPLTTGNQNDFEPQWSPDGKKVLYKSNKDGENTRLYVLWLDSKELLALTHREEVPGQIAWSRDGSWIAYVDILPSLK